MLLWGYSEGGRNAAWAAELQPTYASELPLVAVAAGGVLLLISLTLFLATARHARPRTWYLVLYRIVIASLAVSVPVGVVLSVVRHS